MPQFPDRKHHYPRSEWHGFIRLAAFAKAGIDIDALAKRLQDEGVASFNKSWAGLMACIESMSAAMRKAS